MRQLLGGINISLWGISTNLRDICIDIWDSDNCTATLNMVPRGEQSLVHFLYLTLSSLLLGQDEKPFSKSMLNRKMVFRVTKSQSMKDKISFIWYHMTILWWGGVWGVVHYKRS